jgi:hypothetical protein
MIEIVSAELQTDEETITWTCWLQLTQGPESWMLPATAPGELAEGDLQAYFDAREAELWRVAQAKQYTIDLYERVPLRRLLRAFALVVLDEVNILRGAAGLQERTPDQIVTAIKARLKQ